MALRSRMKFSFSVGGLGQESSLLSKTHAVEDSGQPAPLGKRRDKDLMQLVVGELTGRLVVDRACEEESVSVT